MSRQRVKYIVIRTIRFLLTNILFVSISSLSNFMAYFIAQRITQEVSEDVIRAIHILLSLLAYHSFLRAFLITDAAARKNYYDSNITKLKFLFSSVETAISLVATAVFFTLFPNAFAVKSLYGWLEMPKEYAYLISAAAFLLTFALTWLEALSNRQKTEEKLRKEKSKGKELRGLIKAIISASLAYPIMAYLLPIMFPTFATLPKVIYVVAVALLPAIVVLVLIFSSFSYIRAFFIRLNFFRKLKKATRKNGYILSEIKHPYMSIFRDYDEVSFTVKAHGKKYLCKLLCGLRYGNHIHFAEEGHGIIVKSVRFRAFLYGAKGLGRIGWHNSDELARVETHFSYAFEGDGKKVLLICPTPHSIYATGYGQKRLLDVNDNVYGYTIMTGTAFVNALERNAVK